MNKVGLAWLTPFFLVSGCAEFHEHVTACKEVFVKPEPLVVLRESKDGNQRWRAIRRLKEPSAEGKGKEEQDVVFRILELEAVNGTPLCRLAAMESLGKFKDPRAVPVLVEAFYNTGSYPTDLATRIQSQAVTALGETRNPAAVEFLVRVVREPPAEGPEQEKQLAMDVRMAAARALANFPNYQATDALLDVLKKDKDVGMVYRAHESLQACTGKDLPPDPQTWEAMLHPVNGQAPPEKPSRLHHLVGWFTGK